MNYQFDTILHLDTRLRTMLLRAIIANWQAGERTISSADLYAELVKAGAMIPDGAMEIVFNNLRALKLIAGPLSQNSAAARLHGDICIEWVHPRLLAQSDRP